ncbi:hypothetical protein OXX79_003402 [Metschnikowia pulcherrima]
MYSIILFPILCLLGLVSACAAPETKDSPFAAVYTAIFDKGILGTVVFWSLNGYVSVGVALTNLPSRGGPFMYHVHQQKVTGGSCASTQGHFNPYCGVLNAPSQAEFEVGDLSGKHGMIRGTSTAVTYEDRYLSLNPSNRAFIGNLSIVIHLANGDRIACANIERILSPLTGEQAEAAKAAQQLDLPPQVANLVT